jgi:hypothetical protein
MIEESASQRKWRLVRERQEAKAREREKAMRKPRRTHDPMRKRRHEETYEDRLDDLGESFD